MTARLRELAERWKGDGCRNGSSAECANELLSILDAEGDGGAVAWVADLAPGIERPKDYMGIFTPHKNYADHLAKHPDYVVTPLYAHPARSGGVSDADVLDTDRKNAIEASVEYLKGALDEVYKISGSALLAGEKCKKSDTAICYQLACSVIGSLISAISDLEAIYPSAAMQEQR